VLENFGAAEENRGRQGQEKEKRKRKRKTIGGPAASYRSEVLKNGGKTGSHLEEGKRAFYQ